MIPNLPGWMAWRVARTDKPREPGWTRRIPACMPMPPTQPPAAPERPCLEMVRRFVKR